MEKEMRLGNKLNLKIALFFAMSLLLIVLSAFIGEIAMPFASAFYGALVFAEFNFKNKKVTFSLICAVLSVILTVIFFGATAIWSTVSVISGILIYLMYKFGYNKCDTSVLLTLIISFAIVVSFVLIAFDATNTISFAAVVDYYTDIYKYIKAAFLKQAMEIYSTVNDASGNTIISEEMVIAAIDAFVRTLPSVIMTIAFLISGISLKVYTALACKITDDEKIKSWRFNIPKVYAYFYILLYILSIFIQETNILALAIINLSGIMSFMFAYMGLKFIYRKMREAGKRTSAWLLPTLCILFFGSFAVDLISVFGVVYTVYDRKNSDMSDTNQNNL